MFSYMCDSTAAFQTMAMFTVKNLLLFKKGFKNEKKKICMHENFLLYI